ncbi:MAG: hypothetical protein A2W25_12250 [candidate division Zixibacteria bacterium RBG_16_53_22]|nr:MAG: hypothetical protein A2W25_12250 [candidate division Zixibacteria bacterium RBG_16_53_22]
MVTVWKYYLKPGENLLRVPKGAQFLHAQLQHNIVVIWALVEPHRDAEERRLLAVGTGEFIQECVYDLVHKGTLQLDGGNLIYHVFEVIDHMPF